MRFLKNVSVMLNVGRFLVTTVVSLGLVGVFFVVVNTKSS